MITSNILSFESIISPSGMEWSAFAVITLAAVILGIMTALFFLYKNSTSQSMILTLALLPVIVAVIILLVGRNLGGGIALAGAFSLLKFRSQPGNAREIVSLLLACAIGYACGGGFILVAVLLTVIVVVIEFAFLVLKIGGRSFVLRKLKITVPETLDYVGIFDDILKKYTTRYELVRAKTTAMGSLYEITYEIVLKNPADEKQMMDEIRTRNGNLEVLCGRPTDATNNL